MTFDVLRPKEHANGAGILVIQSGGWYSGSPPPEQSVVHNQLLLDKGFTVFIVRHGSGSKYLLPVFVTASTAPALLVHGDKDPVVPIEHSQNILAEMQKKHVPCELMVIQGADHGIGGDGNAAVARAAWFEKYLLPAKR
jgi:acetyl esterase/lipase